MKRYVITNIIPIKGRKVELYSIQAESKEDAERKFIKGDSGYFLHIEENNTLVFYFDYFIDQIKEFLDQSDIKYVFKDDVDYNELINSYNVIYPYKCMYRL